MRELQIIVLGIMMLLTGNIGAQINPYDTVPLTIGWHKHR